MKKKEIIIKIEFENHKLFFNVNYADARDRLIAERIIAHALNAVDKLRGKRASNAMNSWKITQGRE